MLADHAVWQGFSMIVVRSISPQEGMLYKQLRLGALEDAPDAFSPTWEEISQHDDNYWINAANRINADPDFELLVAERHGAPVGLVSGQVDSKGVGHIGAMWVAPAARSAGVGKRLLESVIDFLWMRKAIEIRLTVTENNANAAALYRRCGFEFTGRKWPLRAGSTLMNLEMVLKPAAPVTETDPASRGR